MPFQDGRSFRRYLWVFILPCWKRSYINNLPPKSLKDFSAGEITNKVKDLIWAQIFNSEWYSIWWWIWSPSFTGECRVAHRGWQRQINVVNRKVRKKSHHQLPQSRKDNSGFDLKPSYHKIRLDDGKADVYFITRSHYILDAGAASLNASWWMK